MYSNMTSLAYEVAFLILTSWAPIWIYIYGWTEKQEDDYEIASSYFSGVQPNQCWGKTIGYRFYILGYILLYILLIVYAADPVNGLLISILVLFGLLLVYQLDIICRRHPRTKKDTESKKTSVVTGFRVKRKKTDSDSESDSESDTDFDSDTDSYEDYSTARTIEKKRKVRFNF